MEPAIVAAMITTGAKVGTWLFDKWTGQKAGKEVEGYVNSHYDTIRALLTNNSVRLLRRLEDGQNHRPAELISVLYPAMGQLKREQKDQLQSEFDYRLFYLALGGLITRPTREYFITPVGVEFLRQAREKRDFMEALHG